MLDALATWAVGHESQIKALKALGELIVLAGVLIAIAVYVARDPKGAPERLIKRAP